MIHNFKKWSLIEHFGNGEETFTEDLEMYGKLRNLDLYFSPGWEIESATGKLTYTATLDVNRSGIEDISFSIESIYIELENRVYKGDDDDDGELEVMEFTFNRDTIGTDPKIEVHNMPFYLHSLEIDFTQAENIDGEIDLKKVKITMDIGKIAD